MSGRDMEDLLAQAKEPWQSVRAPEETEDRLRAALQRAGRPRRRHRRALGAAAAALIAAALLAGNSFDALAYYGKKLFGFDAILSDTLQGLNEAGYGQEVNVTKTLRDGTQLTVDGVMSDENQFIVFYTLRNEAGIDWMSHSVTFWRVSGWFTSATASHGTSAINDEKTEIKGSIAFAPVSPFAKTLTMHYTEAGSHNNISFPYRPHLAMQTVRKLALNAVVNVDNGTIRFQSLTATPTTTHVEGKLTGARFDSAHTTVQGIRLLADGSEVALHGFGHSTAAGGRTFRIRYDALPESFHTLQLEVDNFPSYAELGSHVDLRSGAEGLEAPIPLGDRNLWVRGIALSQGRVEVTIATEDDVLLDGVALTAGAETFPLERTIGQKPALAADRTAVSERTLVFLGDRMPEAMTIKGMHYAKSYGIVVDVVRD